MKAKKDFSVLAELVMNHIGGEVNVSFITHCITRLRINVKDKSLVDLEALTAADKVIGVQWAGDQLQIIM